ncbi:hypothetical protein BH11PSE11_BH11PSE11_32930 [soil metagenome]
MTGASSDPAPATARTRPVASFGKALAWAAGLIVLDAFIFNQGLIALLVGVCIVVVALPLSFLKKFALVRRQRLRNLGIYFCAVLLVLAANKLNNRLARERAELLVSAVKAFQDKHQRYPKVLEDMVPEFIDHVPVAKLTLMQNQFYYRFDEKYKKAMLSYVALPPFGRPTYLFPENRWWYMD